ncbi:lysosome-associated membrane glycoprotein 1 [Hylaeus volcanicus]|uniref:lysosome-associated membrane glycoprotein 1 n=1 Tax=Hylaeus volcanicus TaxID=313075 RepID=UPI0023B7D29A|nr:lysosome-associated membrane glycoprotein 1 [Hylaeus volcanicus]
MSRFLLLFCFASLYVLGEGQEHMTSANNDPLITATVKKNGSLPDSKAKSLPNKAEYSADPALISISKEEIKTPSKEDTVTNHSSQTTVASPNPTTVSTTVTESTVKLSPSTTVGPLVNATVATSPTPGKWIVNETNKICIVVQMSVQFNVSYENLNHTTSYKIFDMPIDNRTIKANGSCGALEQELNLMWSSYNGTNGSMSLHFMKKENDTRYAFKYLNVVLPATNFPNSTLNKTDTVNLEHDASNFVTELSSSYRCVKQQRLKFKQENDTKTGGYLTISGLQFQAFRTSNTTTFGLAKDCALETADIVPIAVGCVLAGLVIIILIAYLVGRRGCQSRGYLSM